MPTAGGTEVRRVRGGEASRGGGDGGGGLGDAPLSVEGRCSAWPLFSAFGRQREGALLRNARRRSWAGERRRVRGDGGVRSRAGWCCAGWCCAERAGRAALLGGNGGNRAEPLHHHPDPGPNFTPCRSGRTPAEHAVPCRPQPPSGAPSPLNPRRCDPRDRDLASAALRRSGAGEPAASPGPSSPAPPAPLSG